MNVYDFDKTIYDGDSTVDFYIYCLKKFPQIIILLPMQLIAIIKYKMKVINKTKMKEEIYGFLKWIPEPADEVKKFWDENEIKIKKWYIKNKQDNDVIISASPEFLLHEICERIGIKYLIASRVEMKSGKYNGLNCYGKEKVNRFFEQFPNASIDKFYSDSYSDVPLAKIARTSFIVSSNDIQRWDAK